MTIKDIARLSGYGVSTVSRALNGKQDISESARKTILSIAKENNFTPNANAMHLKVNYSKSVVIIVKGAFNIFFSGLIERIQGEIDSIGYKLHIKYIDTSDNEVKVAKKMINERKPLGIIFLGGNLDNFHSEFNSISIPCILCSTTARNESYPNLSSVSVDDFLFGEKAIACLAENGHTRIGILGGDITTFCATQLRYQGAMEECARRGIDFSEKQFEFADFTFESAYQNTINLLKRNPDITAIYAMSDVMAVGAIRAVEDSKKRVPNDISIIGFDGIVYSKYYNPRITTFEQPVEEIAAQTVSLLKQMMENKVQSSHILVDAKFINGDSVKQLIKSK